MAHRRARADIVIVNWNSGRFLAQCLDSLAWAKTPGTAVDRVIVVDNASSDDSSSGVPDHVALMRNPANRGFAAACNQGARAGDAPAVLFLNPDTRVSQQAVDSTLRFLAEPGNEGVGIVGIRLCDELGKVQRCTSRTPTPLGFVTRSAALDRLWPRRFPPHFLLEFDHATTRAVEQVMGAFLLIRRPAFEQLGGFDERFFLYYEDDDLCLRARLAGWRVVHFAGAEAFHAGEGTTRRLKVRRLFLLLRSRFRFAAKHYSTLATLAVILSSVALELPARLVRACFRAGQLSRRGRVSRMTTAARPRSADNPSRICQRIGGGGPGEDSG